MKNSQRSALRLLAVTTLVIIASAGNAVTAQAAYVTTVTETAQGVLFAGSGTLNTSAWSPSSTANYGSFVNASELVLFGGPIGATIYVSPQNFSGPASIGPGTTLFNIGNDGPGDKVGLDWVDLFLWTPTGYQSGDSLAGSQLASGQTFATMGLTPGSYEWTWGDGASADSFIVNVTAVPVPAAVWLFGSGLIGLIGIARRKKAA